MLASLAICPSVVLLSESYVKTFWYLSVDALYGLAHEGPSCAHGCRSGHVWVIVGWQSTMEAMLAITRGSLDQDRA